MAAITEQSALIVAVRLPVVGPGAVTRRASSWRRWTCHTHFILVNFAGEWPATTVAPTKAGALTIPIFMSAISVERPRRRQLRRYLRPRHLRLQLHSRQPKLPLPQ